MVEGLEVRRAERALVLGAVVVLILGPIDELEPPVGRRIGARA